MSTRRSCHNNSEVDAVLLKAQRMLEKFSSVPDGDRMQRTGGMDVTNSKPRHPYYQSIPPTPDFADSSSHISVSVGPRSPKRSGYGPTTRIAAIAARHGLSLSSANDPPYAHPTFSSSTRSVPVVSPPRKVFPASPSRHPHLRSSSHPLPSPIRDALPFTLASSAAAPQTPPRAASATAPRVRSPAVPSPRGPRVAVDITASPTRDPLAAAAAAIAAARAATAAAVAANATYNASVAAAVATAVAASHQAASLSPPRTSPARRPRPRSAAAHPASDAESAATSSFGTSRHHMPHGYPTAPHGLRPPPPPPWQRPPRGWSASVSPRPPTRHPHARERDTPSHSPLTPPTARGVGSPRSPRSPWSVAGARATAPPSDVPATTRCTVCGPHSLEASVSRTAATALAGGTYCAAHGRSHDHPQSPRASLRSPSASPQASARSPRRAMSGSPRAGPPLHPWPHTTQLPDTYVGHATPPRRRGHTVDASGHPDGDSGAHLGSHHDTSLPPHQRRSETAARPSVRDGLVKKIRKISAPIRRLRKRAGSVGSAASASVGHAGGADRSLTHEAAESASRAAALSAAAAAVAAMAYRDDDVARTYGPGVDADGTATSSASHSGGDADGTADRTSTASDTTASRASLRVAPVAHPYRSGSVEAASDGSDHTPTSTTTRSQSISALDSRPPTAAVAKHPAPGAAPHALPRGASYEGSSVRPSEDTNASTPPRAATGGHAAQSASRDGADDSSGRGSVHGGGGGGSEGTSGATSDGDSGVRGGAAHPEARRAHGSSTDSDDGDDGHRPADTHVDTAAYQRVQALIVEARDAILGAASGGPAGRRARGADTATTTDTTTTADTATTSDTADTASTHSASEHAHQRPSDAFTGASHSDSGSDNEFQVGRQARSAAPSRASAAPPAAQSATKPNATALMAAAAAAAAAASVIVRRRERRREAAADAEFDAPTSDRYIASHHRGAPSDASPSRAALPDTADTSAYGSGRRTSDFDDGVLALSRSRRSLSLSGPSPATPAMSPATPACGEGFGLGASYGGGPVVDANGHEWSARSSGARRHASLPPTPQAHAQHARSYALAPRSPQWPDGLDATAAQMSPPSGRALGSTLKAARQARAAAAAAASASLRTPPHTRAEGREVHAVTPTPGRAAGAAAAGVLQQGVREPRAAAARYSDADDHRYRGSTSRDQTPPAAGAVAVPASRHASDLQLHGAPIGVTPAAAIAAILSAAVAAGGPAVMPLAASVGRSVSLPSPRGGAAAAPLAPQRTLSESELAAQLEDLAALQRSRRSSSAHQRPATVDDEARWQRTAADASSFPFPTRPTAMTPSRRAPAGTTRDATYDTLGGTSRTFAVGASVSPGRSFSRDITGSGWGPVPGTPAAGAADGAPGPALFGSRGVVGGARTTLVLGGDLRARLLSRPRAASVAAGDAVRDSWREGAHSGRGRGSLDDTATPTGTPDVTWRSIGRVVRPPRTPAAERALNAAAYAATAATAEGAVASSLLTSPGRLMHRARLLAAGGIGPGATAGVPVRDGGPLLGIGAVSASGAWDSDAVSRGPWGLDADADGFAATVPQAQQGPAAPPHTRGWVEDLVPSVRPAAAPAGPALPLSLRSSAAPPYGTGAAAAALAAAARANAAAAAAALHAVRANGAGPIPDSYRPAAAGADGDADASNVSFASVAATPAPPPPTRQQWASGSHGVAAAPPPPSTTSTSSRRRSISISFAPTGGRQPQQGQQQQQWGPQAHAVGVTTHAASPRPAVGPWHDLDDPADDPAPHDADDGDDDGGGGGPAAGGPRPFRASPHPSPAGGVGGNPVRGLGPPTRAVAVSLEVTTPAPPTAASDGGGVAGVGPAPLAQPHVVPLRALPPQAAHAPRFTAIPAHASVDDADSDVVQHASPTSNTRAATAGSGRLTSPRAARRAAARRRPSATSVDAPSAPQPAQLTEPKATALLTPTVQTPPAPTPASAAAPAAPLLAGARARSRSTSMSTARRAAPVPRGASPNPTPHAHPTAATGGGPPSGTAATRSLRLAAAAAAAAAVATSTDAAGGAARRSASPSGSPTAATAAARHAAARQQGRGAAPPGAGSLSLAGGRNGARPQGGAGGDGGPPGAAAGAPAAAPRAVRTHRTRASGADEDGGADDRGKVVHAAHGDDANAADAEDDGVSPGPWAAEGDTPAARQASPTPAAGPPPLVAAHLGASTAEHAGSAVHPMAAAVAPVAVMPAHRPRVVTPVHAADMSIVAAAPQTAAIRDPDTTNESRDDDDDEGLAKDTDSIPSGPFGPFGPAHTTASVMHVAAAPAADAIVPPLGGPPRSSLQVADPVGSTQQPTAAPHGRSAAPASPSRSPHWARVGGVWSPDASRGPSAEGPRTAPPAPHGHHVGVAADRWPEDEWATDAEGVLDDRGPPQVPRGHHGGGSDDVDRRSPAAASSGAGVPLAEALHLSLSPPPAAPPPPRWHGHAHGPTAGHGAPHDAPVSVAADATQGASPTAPLRAPVVAQPRAPAVGNAAAARTSAPRQRTHPHSDAGDDWSPSAFPGHDPHESVPPPQHAPQPLALPPPRRQAADSGGGLPAESAASLPTPSLLTAAVLGALGHAAPPAAALVRSYVDVAYVAGTPAETAHARLHPEAAHVHAHAHAVAHAVVSHGEAVARRAASGGAAGAQRVGERDGDVSVRVVMPKSEARVVVAMGGPADATSADAARADAARADAAVSVLARGLLVSKLHKGGRTVRKWLIMAPDRSRVVWSATRSEIPAAGRNVAPVGDIRGVLLGHPSEIQTSRRWVRWPRLTGNGAAMLHGAAGRSSGAAEDAVASPLHPYKFALAVGDKHVDFVASDRRTFAVALCGLSALVRVTLCSKDVTCLAPFPLHRHCRQTPPVR